MSLEFDGDFGVRSLGEGGAGCLLPGEQDERLPSAAPCLRGGQLTRLIKANATEAARRLAASTLTWEVRWRERDPSEGCYREVSCLRRDNAGLRAENAAHRKRERAIDPVRDEMVHPILPNELVQHLGGIFSKFGSSHPGWIGSVPSTKHEDEAYSGRFNPGLRSPCLQSAMSLSSLTGGLVVGKDNKEEMAASTVNLPCRGIGYCYVAVFCIPLVPICRGNSAMLLISSQLYNFAGVLCWGDLKRLLLDMFSVMVKKHHVHLLVTKRYIIGYYEEAN